MSRLIVGIDQYLHDSYAWLGFDHENQSDETRFVVLTILQLENCWTKMIANAIAECFHTFSICNHTPFSN